MNAATRESLKAPKRCYNPAADEKEIASLTVLVAISVGRDHNNSFFALAKKGGACSFLPRHLFETNHLTTTLLSASPHEIGLRGKPTTFCSLAS